MKHIYLLAMLLFITACGHKTTHNIKTNTQQKAYNGDYWAHRYTYPTNQYNPAWFNQARKQHNKNKSQVPSGKFNKNNPNKGLNTSAFTSLGPKPMNAFNGGFSGRVNVIVTHPTDASIAYIGVDGGGVWKTTNCCTSATTWTNITDDTPINGAAIGDLHIDPNDANTIYAGTGDLRYGSYSFGSSGLLRSTDAGATWQVLGEDVFSPYRDQAVGEFPQYQAIGKIRTNPNDSSQIVVGTKTGVFFSLNNGVDWTGPCLTNSHTTQRQDTTGLEVNASGQIFAAVGTRGLPTPVQPDLNNNGANGIYKADFPSTNSCPNWTLLTTPSNGWPTGTAQGSPTTTIGRIDLAMAPTDNDILYAQVADVTSRAVLGVWKTTDAGINWTKTTTTSEFLGCANSGQQAWYDMGMSVSPSDANTIFLSAVDLFKSENGGNSFTNSTCGYNGGPGSGDFVHVDHHSRAFVAGDDSKLLVGSDGGIYYSGNANSSATNMTYTNLNTTMNTIELYSGDISANFSGNGVKYATGGAQDNGSSVASWAANETVASKAWSQVWGGDGFYAAIEPINNQRVYVESQFGDMAISTSGINGLYFLNQVSPWSNDTPLPFVFSFRMNKHDCTGTCEQLMAGTYRIWETSNGGLNNADWYVNSPNLTKGTLSSRSLINQMEYAYTDGSIAVVATNDGNVQYGFNMGAGSTNSATWVDVTDGNTVLPNRPILDVVTSATTATTAYAAVGGFNQNTPTTPGHLFEVVCDANCSTITWTDKTGNLPNIPVDSVMINPNVPNMLFAGTDWGLYYTNDISVASPTWYRFSAGLPSVMIWDMTIDRGATTLAVFTRSRGAYVWPLPTSIIDDLIFKNGFE